MFDNYRYPMGADTPDAPWNEKDPEPIERYCSVEVALRASKPVVTTDYTVYETTEPWNGIHEREECTALTNWRHEYEEQYMELPRAIEKLCDLVERFVPREKWGECSVSELVTLCRGWQQHDIEVGET